MQLEFDVGVGERHRVVFSFNKAIGNLSITVDGTPVVGDFRFASVSTVKTYEFVVGDREKHTVRIDKHRATLFAGFRPQPVYAYVDGVLVAEGVA